MAQNIKTRFFILYRRDKIWGVLWGLGLGFFLVANTIFGPATPAQAHASYERSNPSNGANLPPGQPPHRVQIWFAENIEPKFSEITVINAADGQVDLGDSRVPPGEPNSLVVTLKTNLPDGTYTVNFKNTSADDGHVNQGGFSFNVGTPAASGEQPTTPVETAGNNPSYLSFWAISLRWLNYLMAAILLGSLAFELLVWRQSVRHARKEFPTEDLAVVDKVYRLGLSRLRKLAWFSLAGLIFGWVGWILQQVTTITGQGLDQVFGLSEPAVASGPQTLFVFLIGTRYGNVWLARLGLLFFMAFVLVLIEPVKAQAAPKNRPAAEPVEPGKVAAATRPGDPPTRVKAQAPAAQVGPGRTPTAVEEAPVAGEEKRPLTVKTGPAAGDDHKWWWGAFIIGLGIMLTSSLTSHAASKEFFTAFTIAFDWLHLVATGVWIGGLVAMAWCLKVAIPRLRAGSGNRTRLLAALIPTFSQIAIICVVALALSGVLLATIEFTDIGQLFSTGYGISLSIKIGLFTLLLGLGAYNLLVVSRRIDKFADPKFADSKAAGSKAAGKLGARFRRIIFLEVGLAVLVFLAAAFLSSSPPPRSLTQPGLSLAPKVIDQRIELSTDPLPIITAFHQFSPVPG